MNYIDTLDIINAVAKRAKSQRRFAGLFLSNAMSDNDTMREMAHRNGKFFKPTAIAFYNYSQHQDYNKLIDDLSKFAGNSFNDDTGACHFYIKYKDDKPIIYDLTHRHSHWMDLKRYSKKYDITINDSIAVPPQSKDFSNKSCIDILEELLNPSNNLEKPHTDNKKLDLLLENVYNNSFHKATYIKTIELLNKEIIKAFTFKSKGLNKGHIDAIILMEDRATQYFASIDYPEQYGFYKSQSGQEMLKFSYLTTFTEPEQFSNRSMNNYLKQIVQKAHWYTAHRFITSKISQNSPQFSGINGHLIGLTTIRQAPSKDYHLYNEYHKRDLEIIKYQGLLIKEKSKKR